MAEKPTIDTHIFVINTTGTKLTKTRQFTYFYVTDTTKAKLKKKRQETYVFVTGTKGTKLTEKIPPIHTYLYHRHYGDKMTEKKHTSI